MSSPNRATKSGVLIKSDGPTKDASVLRARDVRFELQGRNVDPVVMSIMERLAERSHFVMSRLTEMAMLQDQMINIIQQFSDIAGNMKEKMEAIHTDIKGEGVDETTN